MASNPRKFSEKIALHKQREAEEKAAFDQIMKEVMDVTTKPTPPSNPLPVPPKASALHLPNLSAYRGGSLPNVNQMAHHQDKSGQRLYTPSSSPRNASRSSIGPVRSSPNRRVEATPYASPNMSHGHSGSNNLLMTNYLSPPMDDFFDILDSSWRRANSDSALNSLMIPSTVPDSSDESIKNSFDQKVMDMSGLLEIPQSVSTGSLPDLTQFQFPPPLQNPVDIDEPQNQSPYSTSPLTGSSVTYSPTSVSPQQLLVQPNLLDGLGVNSNSASSTFHNFAEQNPNRYAYRTPPRPSPQNSPSPFPRSGSPLDGQLSGPASPGGAQPNSESFYLSQQAQALQQHFEHFSMMDNNCAERVPVTWQGGGMVSSYPYVPYQGGIPTGSTAGIGQISPHHPQPQTPNTPSSIPEIIFTEFMGSDFPEMRAEPLEEFFGSEAAALALREGLGPLDPDSLHLLSDPDGLVLSDPNAEDAFRLDRL